MIQPGLERIARLLQDVHFPWKSIHVAGTNGKGSICAYASALLTRRTIRNGRFTSPHLIHRWDCIAINDKPVSEQLFRKVEDHFTQLNKREAIQASEFEILTATAFEIFNREKVQVGVVEVGMGGKLDATNILNNQAISVISVIARDHENFLGGTLEEIARHKAGILRPNTPYIVNPMNEWNVHHVIDDYAKEIGAGPRIIPDSEHYQRELYKSKDWEKFTEFLEPPQRDNGALAFIAFEKTLESMNFSTPRARQMLPALKRKNLGGRMQKVKLPEVFNGSRDARLWVDGAHNVNAAEALRAVMDRRQEYQRSTPTTWVLAMSEGKDAFSFLCTLLRPGDSVITTAFQPVDGMPWVKPMDPDELLCIAKSVCENITGMSIPKKGAFRAICAAKYFSPRERIALTGSLYLVGDFMREKEALKSKTEEYFNINEIDEEERQRVHTSFSKSVKRLKSLDMMNRPTLSDKLQGIDRELAELEQEERRLVQERQFSVPRFGLGPTSMPTARIPVFDDEARKRNLSVQAADSQGAPTEPEPSQHDSFAQEDVGASNESGDVPKLRLRKYLVDDSKMEILPGSYPVMVKKKS